MIKGVLVESIDDMTSTIALGLNQKKNNGKYHSRRKFIIYFYWFELNYSSELKGECERSVRIQ